MSSTISPHLDDLTLELARTGDAPDDALAHLSDCGDCRARVALLEQLAVELGPSEEIEIPAAVDDAVLAIAAERAAVARAPGAPRAPRRWTLPAVVAGTLAAAAAMLLIVPMQMHKEPPPSASYAAQDLNRDGTVDIVDALVLARKLESEEEPEAGWDIDGDARVDARDAERLALAAVSLGGVR